MNNIVDNVKKVYINKLNITTFILKKLNLFHYMQLLLLKVSILIHFNLKRRLYININIFKKCDIRRYLYYILNKLLNKSLSLKMIQLILFLSYNLINVETWY